MPDATSASCSARHEQFEKSDSSTYLDDSTWYRNARDAAWEDFDEQADGKFDDRECVMDAIIGPIPTTS